MPSMIMELSVEMDDGSIHKVVADQRDIARWEAQSFGWPVVKIEEQMSMRFLRFLGWSAMFRQQLTTLTWEAFDARCVEAAPLDEEEGSVPADAGDPGQPAPSATRSSSSRTGRAKR